MSMVGRFRGGLKMLTTIAPPNHRRMIGGGGGGVPNVINRRLFSTNRQHPPHSHTPPQNPTYAGPTKFYSKSGHTRRFFSRLGNSVWDSITYFRMTRRQLFVMIGIVFVLPPVARVCDDLFNPNCFTYRRDQNHVTYLFKLGKDVTEDEIQLHFLRKTFLVVSSRDGKQFFKKRLPSEKFSKIEQTKFRVKEDSASLMVDVAAVNSSSFSWLKKLWVNE